MLFAHVEQNMLFRSAMCLFMVFILFYFEGCVPSEDEINEIISATEFEDSNGTIHLSRFLPHVTQLLAEHR